MGSKIKVEIRLEVWNKYKNRCAYCGQKITFRKMQVDHITPIYRGSLQSELSVVKGKNNISNYNPSCGSCNSSKSTYTLEHWRDEILLKQDRVRRDSSTFRLLERFGLVKCNKNIVKFYFEKEVYNG